MEIKLRRKKKPYHERRGLGTNNRDGKKSRKRMEAESRNAEWNKLTKEQKIESLRSRRGESDKQLKKLQGQ